MHLTWCLGIRRLGWPLYRSSFIQMAVRRASLLRKQLVLGETSNDLFENRVALRVGIQQLILTSWGVAFRARSN